MKALFNGVPNLSVLDGWWIEGYSGTNGWAIGSGFGDGDEDAYDADSLYTLLEHEVLARVLRAAGRGGSAACAAPSPPRPTSPRSAWYCNTPRRCTGSDKEPPTRMK